MWYYILPGVVAALFLWILPFWVNGYFLPLDFSEVIRLVKTWKPKLYEIPGLTHHFSFTGGVFNEGNWYPHTRFMVEYRRGYYILDKENDEWVWKRPSMVGTLGVDNHKTPTDKLRLLIMTGLSWKNEVKKIKKLKYKKVPIIMGCEDLVWRSKDE